MSDPSSSPVQLRAVLKGHNGWVTCLATTAENPNMVLSGSRDKTLMIWKITKDSESFGHPHKSLTGHNHFVSDVVISSDGQFALSSSWDSTLRLWDLNYGTTSRRFVGHTKDVLSVAFSADNRLIVSGSRDKSLKLWNTLGECKYTIDDANAHTDWVSTVRFSPNPQNPIFVSGGWDKLVKVWNISNWKLKTNLVGHTGFINAVTVSPDGTLCASGGKDGTVRLWDLSKGTPLDSLSAGDVVHALCFSPTRYWLCAATQTSIRIWDLETKNQVCELTKNFANFQNKTEKSNPAPVSLAWSADGKMLFSGWTDNLIRVWEVVA